jgi:hypothetical protein
MGNTQPTQSRRFLSRAERKLDSIGLLYKTIGNVWGGGKAKPFAGSYENALKMRKDKRPDMYQAAIMIHEADGTAANDAEANFLSMYGTVKTVSEAASGSVEVEMSLTKGTAKNAIQSSSEPASEPERDAETITITQSVKKSEAHLIPDDENCRRHWDKIVVVASGYRFDANHHDRLKSLTDHVSLTRANLLILNGDHQSYYDHLGAGILLVIPLLPQEEIAKWNHKEPYDVLVVCNTAATYRLFADITDLDNCYWATGKDLKLATDVLEEQVKILADSLVSNWDGFHNQLNNGDENDMTRHKTLQLLKEVLEKSGKVQVPDFESVVVKSLKYNPLNPFSDKLKLLKVSLGQIYTGETASRMPDPLLLAIKAANNWSYHAYGKRQSRIQQLLPVCSFLEGEDNDDVSSGGVSIGFGMKLNAEEIKEFLKKIERRREQEIINTFFELTTVTRGSDMASVSDLSAEEMPVVTFDEDDPNDSDST